MLPHAWLGNPRDSRVILLQLNPGFSETDVDDERSIPAYRLIVRATLTLDGQAGFWPLDPRLATTSGAQWWRPRLRPLIEALGAGGEALVAAGLSVVEYFPYHSLSYQWPPRLPSQEFGFHLVREAAAAGAVVLVMRQWESWRAAVPEVIGYWLGPRTFPLFSTYYASGHAMPRLRSEAADRRSRPSARPAQAHRKSSQLPVTSP